jgi:hypothetical protein
MRTGALPCALWDQAAGIGRQEPELIYARYYLTGSLREPYGIKQRALVDKSRN